MAREDAIKVEGLVTEVLPNGTYHVRLANGHGLVGFVPGKARETVRLAPGDKVSLELQAVIMGVQLPSEGKAHRSGGVRKKAVSHDVKSVFLRIDS